MKTSFSTSILPMFQEIVGICCGSLANFQGPGTLFLLLVPSIYFSNFFSFQDVEISLYCSIEKFWHHYSIWSWVLTKDQAWGDASCRWELATKREGKMKIILISCLEHDLAFYDYYPRFLAVLFFYGTSYWCRLFSIVHVLQVINSKNMLNINALIMKLFITESQTE